MNGSDEFGFAERFADNHCIRLAHPQPSSIAADEHVCERPRSEYFLDSGNAAAPTQPGVHNHQVWIIAGGRAHCLGLGGRCRANIVPHARPGLRNARPDWFC